jgi:hypothetical protein
MKTWWGDYVASAASDVQPLAYLASTVPNVYSSGKMEVEVMSAATTLRIFPAGEDAEGIREVFRPGKPSQGLQAVPAINIENADATLWSRE